MPHSHTQQVLIGKPVGPVALDVAAAFWQTGQVTRVSYSFFSGATLVMLCLTALGGLECLTKLDETHAR